MNKSQIEPVLIYTDKSEKQNVEHKLNDALEFIQNVVGKYNAIVLMADNAPKSLPKLTENDFIALFNNTFELMYSKVTNGAPLIIGGLELDAEKAMDIIKDPKGYGELINAIELLKTAQLDPENNFKGYLTNVAIEEYFTISKDGTTVLLSKSGESTIENAGKKFLRKDESIKMHEFSLEVVALFKEKGFRLKDNGPDSIVEVLKNSIKYISPDFKVTPNIGYLGGI